MRELERVASALADNRRRALPALVVARPAGAVAGARSVLSTCAVIALVAGAAAELLVAGATHLLLAVGGLRPAILCACVAGIAWTNYVKRK